MYMKKKKNYIHIKGLHTYIQTHTHTHTYTYITHVSVEANVVEVPLVRRHLPRVLRYIYVHKKKKSLALSLTIYIYIYTQG